MKKSYQIADLSIGGNVIHVTATVEDDGSLTIYDLSYGPAADRFYGKGRDVEVWLKLTPDSVEQFSRHLIKGPVDDPADETARIVASLYQDDSRALRKVQKMLEEHGIKYEETMWN